jgi:DNA adenine methylase
LKITNIPLFIKWAGGKSQLLGEYEKFLPKKIKSYYDPFVGGGALFFYVKITRNPTVSMISDINKPLIDLYTVVRDEVDNLINKLIDYDNEHKEAVEKSKIKNLMIKNQNKKDLRFDHYYQKRNEYNSIKTNTWSQKIKKSALFIYLNKTCYNGLYRVNANGEFNVPFGQNIKPSIVPANQLRAASILLQDVEIKTMRYNKIKEFVEKGDFIYFDPPYDPISMTSKFTNYQRDGFTKKKQEQLAHLFYKLDKIGCKLMLSNSDTTLIDRLYHRYDAKGLLFTVKAKRMINCNGAGRKPVKEKIILNYKPPFFQNKIYPY